MYVCLDASIQEQVVDPAMPLPAVERFRPASPAEPSQESVARAADALSKATRPLILVGRVSADGDDWKRRVQLAERLNARVLTDLKTGARFPTQHRLHPYAPGIFVSGDAVNLIREADVILSLDWVDLAGALKVACGGTFPQATIIQCSADQYVHNGWSMDYQALPPADISMLASPDALVRRLLEVLGPAPTTTAAATRAPAAAMHAVVTPPARDAQAPVSRDAAVATARQPATAPPQSAIATAPTGVSIEDLARATVESLAAHNPSYIRLPIGWPGQYCNFGDPLDYIGFDGGGGIGSGPGMAVGAAIALQKSGRLPVAILGDGDYLMGLTALWTAVHYDIPLLVVVANNHSFFNDELHQERTARVRNRPIENRWVGMRMSDPPLNLATLAIGQGAVGLGPVDDVDSYQSALADAVAQVKAGAICVVDVHVAPEYARAVSSALLRHIPDEHR